MLRRFVEIFLSIPAPLAVAAVFLVTAGETAIFLGLVLPGELAVILGGVLASQKRVPLVAVLIAGVMGPVIGDSIGYFLGRRYGRRFLSGRRRKRWAKARAWLARWEAFAVFLGRFTAFLRSIIPAAAGAARLPYGRFLPWNVAAGVLWGVGSVLLGYFAGLNYETLARRAGLLSLALFALLLSAAIVSLFRRRKRALRARARRSRRTRASRSGA
jgi:membrane-associated protein